MGIHAQKQGLAVRLMPVDEACSAPATTLPALVLRWTKRVHLFIQQIRWDVNGQYSDSPLLQRAIMSRFFFEERRVNERSFDKGRKSEMLCLKALGPADYPLADIISGGLGLGGFLAGLIVYLKYGIAGFGRFWLGVAASTPIECGRDKADTLTMTSDRDSPSSLSCSLATAQPV